MPMLLVDGNIKANILKRLAKGPDRKRVINTIEQAAQRQISWEIHE